MWTWFAKAGVTAGTHAINRWIDSSVNERISFRGLETSISAQGVDT